MKVKMRIRWGIALLASCVTLSGCLSNPQQKALEPTASDQLVLAVGAEPEGGFDPATGWGRYGSPLFQSTLLKRNSEMQLENDLATGYEISSDGQSWTVKLRKDIRFSDGKPLTADDVQFTFETAAKSGTAIDLTNLESVKAGDEATVTFKLKEPQSTFTSLLVSTGIVPRHAYGKDYASHPIGSGPFKLVQWDKGQQVIVEANRDYYGKQPFFNKITFLFLKEDAAFAAARAGKVDVSYIPAAFSRQKVDGMRLEALKTVDNRGMMFPYVKSGQRTKEGYPVGNDVTADLSIRKAINTALDRKALVAGILEGYGSPAYTVNDGLPWWNPETVFADANVQEARKLLADSGWQDTDGDGVIEKEALKAEFSLLYPAGDATRQSLALAVVDMIKPIGIKIQVAGKSWDELEKMMYANAVLFGWGSHDPLEMYNLYSSAYKGADYYNTGYYSNPTVDNWMHLAMLARTEEAAWDYWKKSQWDGKTGSSARGDAAWAWLVNIDHLYLVKEKLDIGKQKIHPHGHGWPVTDNIADWRWKQ